MWKIKRLMKCTIIKLFPVTIMIVICFYKLENIYHHDRFLRHKLAHISIGKKFDLVSNSRLFITDDDKNKPSAKGMDEYLIFPNINCTATKMDIVSLIKSAPKNKRLRSAIRSTWGKNATLNGNKLLFSIGRTHNGTLEEMIKEEASRFHDILQGNYLDTYYNLTMKTIRGIHWIARYCPNAHFVLLVDDDVIVNFENLFNFVSHLEPEETKNLFTGYVITDARPYRKGTKFAISMEEYPNSVYPSYVSGPVVITTGKVLQLFDKTFPLVKPFVFEDVYLGMVAETLQIRLSPMHNNLFDHDGRKLHKTKCFLTSHLRDMNVTGEFYERIYIKHKHSVCRDTRKLIKFVY